MGIARNSSKSDENADKSSRDWCGEAAARLHAERPEDALTAARAAAGLDPAGEWPHRLTGLALERLGRDRDALPPARQAVRLAPGSWAARLGLATVLSHLPGHWDEAAGQAALARRYAPGHPDPLVLEGDLALLRGAHGRAEAAYRAALRLDPGHLQAHVNLGLALLRWDPPHVTGSSGTGGAEKGGAGTGGVERGGVGAAGPRTGGVERGGARAAGVEMGGVEGGGVGAAGAGVRVARRNVGVALWILVGRTWSVLAALTAVALVAGPRAAPVAMAAGVLAAVAPYPLLRASCRAHRGCPWHTAAAVLLVLAAAGCAAGGALGAAWAWWAGPGALAAVAALLALLSARAWWRGAPGPWRSSLLRCDLPAGTDPSVPLHPRVRRAFAYARTAVLSFGDALGPRMVGAATSVGPSGDLRVVVGDEAWEAVEADPRVAVFAADPDRGRRWVEVRGIAVAGPGALRVTPEQVLVGEFPGRHQRLQRGTRR
ncbi:hypothetical protein [Nonomuraea indica]|uniref:hypothetical protein n=1 Tax=Nonomuraea indica TaxID=1581193 RepID=UPI0011834969|nr:hypothetical protein [Nonomuraea indica]